MNFNKHYNQVVAMALLILIFTSCHRVKPEAPPESTLDTLIEPPVSVLYVPVQYRVSGFEKLINDKVQGTFVDKWLALNEGGDSLQLRVSKVRPITLKRKDRTLFIVIPIRVSGKVRAKFAGVKIKNESYRKPFKTNK